MPRNLSTRLRALATTPPWAPSQPENALLLLASVLGGASLALVTVLRALARLPRPLPSVVARNAAARFFRILPASTLSAAFAVWAVDAGRTAFLSWDETRAIWDHEGRLGERDAQLLEAQRIHPDLPAVVRALGRLAGDDDDIAVTGAAVPRVEERLRYLLFPRRVGTGTGAVHRVYLGWGSLPAIAARGSDGWLEVTKWQPASQVYHVDGDGVWVLGVDLVGDPAWIDPDEDVQVNLYFTGLKRRVCGTAIARGSTRVRFDQPVWIWGGPASFEVFPVSGGDGCLRLGLNSSKPYQDGFASSDAMRNGTWTDLAFSIAVAPPGYDPEVVLPDAAILRRQEP